MNGPLKYICALVAIVVAWVVYKFVTRDPDKDIKRMEEEVSKVEAGNAILTDVGISSIEAQGYANQLQQAMDGPGTDADEIEAIIDDLTPGDLRIVHTEFGVRDYNGLGGSTSWDYFFGTTGPKTLDLWFKSELGWFNGGLLNKISGMYKAAGMAF